MQGGGGGGGNEISEENFKKYPKVWQKNINNEWEEIENKAYVKPSFTKFRDPGQSSSSSHAMSEAREHIPLQISIRPRNARFAPLPHKEDPGTIKNLMQ